MNVFNHVFCFSYYIIIVWLNSLVEGTLSFGPFWLSPMTLSMMGVACFITWSVNLQTGQSADWSVLLVQV